MVAQRKKRIVPISSRKAAKSTAENGCFDAPAQHIPAVRPPDRGGHDLKYHYPLLLQDKSACDRLLDWFEAVEQTRNMPWRKSWINPKTYPGTETLSRMLTQRAYEVWVSEVMLQQTRVSTVIHYFNNWISQWPTIEELANANHDDVLSAWKGLGYYSRATRLHEGAQVAISKATDPLLPIPSTITSLQQLPGIGRYTAGAISSIAFGQAEPVLDGNVARVLSRQLGLYIDVKDKMATDCLWREADRLIKHVSALRDGEVSATPGRWNQALMELGSTICTPRPKCNECPIQSTCRVYEEGMTLATERRTTAEIPDIEDACNLCLPLDTEDLVSATGATVDQTQSVEKKRKSVVRQNNTLSNYFSIRASSPKTKADTDHESSSLAKKRKFDEGDDSSLLHKATATYCGLFPKRAVKKQVAEESCVVCLLELDSPNMDNMWLVEQRPDKGLLASLWQFPQCTIVSSVTTAEHRKAFAQDYISSLELGDFDPTNAKFVASYPPLVHVFTHLKLTMHTYRFKLNVADGEPFSLLCPSPPTRRWIRTLSMDEETLSTGNRRCWELYLQRQPS